MRCNILWYVDYKVYPRGNFENEREFWNEVTSIGVILELSQDIVNPSITKLNKWYDECREFIKRNNDVIM